MRHRSDPHRLTLTTTAQQAVAEVLGTGMRAVDATVGNGHDTAFLARAVSPGGRVIGLDVQAVAIDATTRRLQAAGLREVVDLRLIGHQHLARVIPPDWPGTVAAVMFNLGYLPGSDKRVITRPDSTLLALTAATEVLGPSGLLSVLVYPGHSGGDAEAAAVEQWASSLADRWHVHRQGSRGPTLYLIGHAPP